MNTHLNSLDPRVNRLPDIDEHGGTVAKVPLDQFGTFEVFVQPKEGKPFQHEGAVHAPNLDMAFILAKETFTRRFTCISMYVADTKNVFVSPMTEGEKNVYDLIRSPTDDGRAVNESFEIYHLLKRGKQHIHVGTLQAAGPEEALAKAKLLFNVGKPVSNVWALRSRHILFTSPEEQDLWLTLPDKKFRDATEYKGGDKLKSFLELNRTPS